MTVVLLHGFTGDSSTMAELAEQLGVACETPDLAGHGADAARPPTLGRFGVDRMVEDVLGGFVGPIDLVGYSMGGRVALSAACRRPERIRSLSLIGASAGLADPDERAARAAADDELADLIEQDLGTFVDRWMANPLFATQARLGEGFLAEARAQRLRNSPRHLARSLREASTGRMTPLHGLLDRCTMPVGLIVGADDPKFLGIADDLDDRLPDAEIHVIADAGHAAHLEQPAAVAAAIHHTMARA